MAIRRSRLVRLNLVTLLLMMAPAALAQQKAETEVQWRTNYQLARQEALEKRQPPILIVYTEPVSIYCEKFKRTTLDDPRVVELLNTHFIPFSIDGTKNGPSDIIDAFNLHLFPTSILATPDGKIISTIVGYRNAGAFCGELLQALEFVAAATATDWRINSGSRHVNCYPR